MGLSPRGSNGRPRSTLIFYDTADRDLFKGLATDLAECAHVAPTEAVLDALVRATVGTPEGEQTARAVYSTGSPSCKALFVDFFRQATIAGDKGRNALLVVNLFLDHITRFDACIDTADGKADHLASLWDQLVDMLGQHATTGEPNALLAAANAKTMGLGVLRDSRAIVSPSALVLTLTEQWDKIRDRRVAYAILHEISVLMRPTRRGVTETAQDRLGLLRKIDAFYQEDKEVMSP